MRNMYTVEHIQIDSQAVKIYLFTQMLLAIKMLMCVCTYSVFVHPPTTWIRNSLTAGRKFYTLYYEYEIVVL